LIVLIDIDLLSLKYALQLFLSQHCDGISFTSNFDQAQLIVGPSYRSYPTPTIKFTDTVSPLIEDDQTVAVVPFPDTEDSMVYLVKAINDLPR
jgi:hypothetical protein